jgi:apolipoprotein N-acyltransferase
MAYWLLSVQWLRLPHPANHLGLLLLAAYLGAYLPLTIGLTRVGVHRLRMPLWLAAPIAWTGLEWVRARLLTGFLMASLAHTQVQFTEIIQIADLLGEYGVTFLIVLIAAAIAGALPLWWLSLAGDSAAEQARAERPLRTAVAALAPAVLLFGATYLYGFKQMADYAVAAKLPRHTTIALIQSDMLADWKGTPARDAAVMQQMEDLSRQAVDAAQRTVDLVVWPETMYRDPLLMVDEVQKPTAEFEPAQLDATRRSLAALSADFGAALLVGLDRYNAVAADKTEATPYGYHIDVFNSSALVDRAGQLIGTYDKMHLLPFGEFIPFVKWLPFLRQYSPITGAAIPGAPPRPLVLDNVCYAVSICYETVLPHLIRRQFVHLIRSSSTTPDVMVNLTNDAWYWGSSELDMHLASGVFRAVEMRTPLVVAANRGLSAHVDHLGQIRQVTERNQPAWLVAEVKLPPRRGMYPSPFARYGDWFALVCLLCSVALAVVGWRWPSSEPQRDCRTTNVPDFGSSFAN